MSTSSQLWEQVVTVALVGTERQPLPPVGDGSALAGLLARLDAADAEGALLGAAAALGIYRHAGWLPAVDERPVPEPCPPDDLPRCSTPAARCLLQILNGSLEALLPEWLALTTDAGRRAPESLLPELLEHAKQATDWQERRAILPVLGRRGRWLAALNRDWEYVAQCDVAPDVDVEPVWQTGSQVERLFLLRRLRDSDPARARELLASTWAEEQSADRAVFLGLLQSGLSMADEPFLEEALDDRRKNVRQAAAYVLMRLAGSRLCLRMIERVVPLLAYAAGATGELLGGLSRRARALEVTLPKACDRSMVRDGIETNAPQGWGARVWWLAQMLSAVPPGHWCERWQTPPADLIAAARQSEWQTGLIDGWANAAIRHADAGWAEAVLQVRPQPDVTFGRLVETLPAARRESHVLRVLKSDSGPLRGDHPAFLALRACDHAWSPDLARAVLERVRHQIAKGEVGYHVDWHLRSSLKEYARHIPPALAEEVASGWPEEARDWPAWSQAVDDFLVLLRFRRQMHNAFRE
jgi:Family of unknown function (DUF5691)